jgi:hypothetical protein
MVLNKIKGKAVPVLNSLSTVPLKTFSLDLGIRWRSVVSFTPRPLYPQGNRSRVTTG